MQGSGLSDGRIGGNGRSRPPDSPHVAPPQVSMRHRSATGTGRDGPSRPVSGPRIPHLHQGHPPERRRPGPCPAGGCHHRGVRRRPVTPGPRPSRPPPSIPKTASNTSRPCPVPGGHRDILTVTDGVPPASDASSSTPDASSAPTPTADRTSPGPEGSGRDSNDSTGPSRSATPSTEDGWKNPPTQVWDIDGGRDGGTIEWDGEGMCSSV